MMSVYPAIDWFPYPDKHWVHKYLQPFYFQILFFLSAPVTYTSKAADLCKRKRFPHPVEDLMPIYQLIVMLCLPSEVGPWTIFRMWIFMHCLAGYWGFFTRYAQQLQEEIKMQTINSLLGTHHDPSVYHPGDKPRESLDWGLHTMDSTNDSDKSIFGGLFGTTTLLGDHMMHHFFPTVDASRLQQLYPLLYETCHEFGLKPPGMSGMHTGLKLLFQQLVRTQGTSFEERYKAKP